MSITDEETRNTVVSEARAPFETIAAELTKMIDAIGA
jgi:hypothetical protein